MLLWPRWATTFHVRLEAKRAKSMFYPVKKKNKKNRILGGQTINVDSGRLWIRSRDSSCFRTLSIMDYGADKARSEFCKMLIGSTRNARGLTQIYNTAGTCYLCFDYSLVFPISLPWSWLKWDCGSFCFENSRLRAHRQGLIVRFSCARIRNPVINSVAENKNGLVCNLSTAFWL